MAPRRARPDSPDDRRKICGDAAVAASLQQFLDEWYYRILHSSVVREMNRREALRTFLDVLEIFGVKFALGEKEAICALDRDEEAAIARIVECMPLRFKEQWDFVSLQLQTVVHATTRVRTAAELKGEGADDGVAAVFEEGSTDGVMQHILKGACVFTAKNVGKLRTIHTTWRKSTDARIHRMAMLQEDAEHCAQELIALEAHLADIGATEKGKSKSLLMILANGSDKALMHSCLASWRGLAMQSKDDHDIHKRFEDQVFHAETKFIQFRAKQIESFKHVMNHMFCEENEAILRDTWLLWTQEIQQRKLDGDSAQSLKEIQAKLASFADKTAESAKKVMARLAGNQSATVMQFCFEAWLDFDRLARQEKELEEAVKKTQLALKKRLEERKEETRHLMATLMGSCDSGLLALMIRYWTEHIKEEKDARAMAEALQGQSSKFKTLCNRQRAGAGNVQNRVNEQMTLNLLQRTFSPWVHETKVNQIQQAFSNKYTSKKRQLQGVQNLFKSFAMQLEQNLGNDEEEDLHESTARFSTGRTQASQKRSGKHQQRESRRGESAAERGMARDAMGSVSLPDIHSGARGLLV